MKREVMTLAMGIVFAFSSMSWGMQLKKSEYPSDSEYHSSSESDSLSTLDEAGRKKVTEHNYISAEGYRVKFYERENTLYANFIKSFDDMHTGLKIIGEDKAFLLQKLISHPSVQRQCIFLANEENEFVVYLSPPKHDKQDEARNNSSLLKFLIGLLRYDS